MEIVASLIKLFFGSKADKDRKQIEPYLEKIKAVCPSIEALSNDELRARSEALKKQIADFIARDEADIVELKAKLELPETSLEEKERISKEIDETTKRIDEKIEEKLDEILPEAFAIMKDTARRFAQNDEVVVTANDFDRELAATKDFVKIEGDKAIYATHWLAGGNDVRWDMIHYDVQLFGGVVLHKGKIAEMATGEGKTLVATLPVFLNALAGKGVHMVTVNDYLARRDSEWMGPMYQFHGLTVDCIDRHQPNSDARRKAYMADITFGTNNEYGFDYLRDNMASSPKDLVQRKHHFAIVDEVDSILIDEARTPLIIAGQGDKSTELYEQADRFARTLKAYRIKEMDAKDDQEDIQADYIVDEKARTATITPQGARKAEQYFGIADITGAYIAGIVLCSIQDAPYVERRVDISNYTLFAPVFFASIGLKTDISGLTAEILLFSVCFVVIALVTKIIGCGLAAKVCRFSWPDSLKVGVGMMTRGEVALIVAQKGLGVGVVDSVFFTAVLLLIVVSSIITPLVLKGLFAKG